ncbi:mediator of RNA polymerase II transcription subunit 6-like [Macrosteles quadrilineatus]|uniref:mediator of RNA polymerase II transcription subunit 6-like n=1 Tax=Macrosteles quadrilineatus TaxID=74068 RepID=UPI0023E23BE1|nr:mediator of RNA polymerase II transcription subunit 6-like [Macrosteles quadrilineatus]XP_054275887.1 mediator of RNA polymerase II transcription subunit 6-like [Macrosteles quadrilineatus]
MLPAGMMPGRVGIMPEQNNPLQMSWHDSSWVPILNPTNIMDYFSDRNNPFYDRTCNNEILKMQRASLDQLNNMTGYEYILLHVQDPILYVVRKQHRTSPTQATPLADYYIIAGIIYQAPDLSNIINSRILASVHHLQSALDEAMGYSRYHPSKGYTWELRGDTTKVKKETQREEPSSVFQRQRVDMLLGELIHKFPLPIMQPPPATKPPPSEPEIKTEPREIKQEIKQESMKPPPEKKPRLN